MSRILLVGAGHTHVELLRRGSELREAGHEVIVVSPEAEHPYSGMGPGVLSGQYRVDQVMLPVADLAQAAGFEFIADRVTACDPDRRMVTLTSGAALHYDLLSLNLGSEASEPATSAAAEREFTAKPVVRLIELRRRIEEHCSAGNSCEVSVIGAGPAGLEIACAVAELLSRLNPGQVAVHLFDAGQAPAGLKGRRRSFVLKHLKAAGVQYHPDQRCSASHAPGDFVVLSTGLVPPRVLQGFGLPCAADGSLRVDRYLRSVADPRVFAVGDCAHFDPMPLDRVGVYAVRMQQVLLHNLLRSAVQSPDSGLSPFRNTGRYLAGFNLGFGKGLLHKGRWSLYGRPAFLLKDAIDRRFMRRYRVG